jgi:hypothetical protein
MTVSPAGPAADAETSLDASEPHHLDVPGAPVEKVPVSTSTVTYKTIMLTAV